MSIDLGLKGKVAVVTAGSKGLGKATALALLRAGSKVAICSRTKADIEATANELRETVPGAQVLPLTADVTKQSDIDDFISAVQQKWGTVDVLIGNCGGPPVGNFMDFDADIWTKATNMTLGSCVRLCYAVLPGMIAQKSGSIVFIQSFTVKHALPRMVLSNSIRMAVSGLTKSLSKEVGPHGIRVNTIAPGAHQTARFHNNVVKLAKNLGKSVEDTYKVRAKAIPLGFINSPENFGENTVWLASEAARYLTGQTIVVDGGTSMSAL